MAGPRLSVQALKYFKAQIASSPSLASRLLSRLLLIRIQACNVLSPTKEHDDLCTSRCQIACPPFMSVGYLEQVLRREREDAAVFTPLPHHYLEIASLLLNTASDDIGEL